MLIYLTRRLLLAALTLWLVTILVYGLIRSMPGNPLQAQEAALSPDMQLSPADRERMMKLYGLDKPWHVAYFTWMGNLVVERDLGNSFNRNVPVSRLIGERIGLTLKLTVSSLLLAYLLSIPLGLYCSVRGGAADERALSTVLYMLYSMPVYVAALILQYFLAFKYDLLPLFGSHSEVGWEAMTAWQKTVDGVWHAILPVTCFTYGSLAYYSRFIRANMQEALREDYVRTARAKGLGPVRVTVGHAFRNTLIPLATLMGLTLPTLLSGSIILEQIFSWQGIGSLFFESIGTRDYSVIMALTLMFAVLTLAGQLLADILYAVVDPRVRLN